MKIVIAWLFLILSPLVGGIIVCIGIATYLHADIAWISGGYCLLWVTLFGTWFDGSEYQNLL